MLSAGINEALVMIVGGVVAVCAVACAAFWVAWRAVDKYLREDRK